MQIWPYNWFSQHLLLHPSPYLLVLKIPCYLCFYPYHEHKPQAGVYHLPPRLRLQNSMSCPQFQNKHQSFPHPARIELSRRMTLYHSTNDHGTKHILKLHGIYGEGGKYWKVGIAKGIYIVHFKALATTCRTTRITGHLSRVINNFSNYFRTWFLCRSLEIRRKLTLQADESGQSIFMKGMKLYHLRQKPRIFYSVMTFLCQPLITGCEY
jgi:hypothetical protein